MNGWREKVKISLRGSDLYIHQKVGKLTLARYLKGVKRIFVPRSVYEQMPAKYWKALEEMGIEIVRTTKRGRPPISCDVLKEICRERRKGAKLKEVVGKAGISLRSFFNLKKRCPKACPREP